MRRSIWDLTLKRARGGHPHICRVSWQADVAGLQAVDHNGILLGMPVQADLTIDHWHQNQWSVVDICLPEPVLAM